MMKHCVSSRRRLDIDMYLYSILLLASSVVKIYFSGCGVIPRRRIASNHLIANAQNLRLAADLLSGSTLKLEPIAFVCIAGNVVGLVHVQIEPPADILFVVAGLRLIVASIFHLPRTRFAQSVRQP
jgi:hypothetical protein